MAKTRAQRQVYADLLDRYGRSVADAFFAALDKIKAAASVQRITAEIEAGNIEGALDELDIDPADFNDLLDHIRDAQKEGGKAAADEMPKRRPDGTALSIRYDGRAYNAETWMREHSSDFITRTTSDMRAASRASLADNLAKGRNPKSAALDLIGRLNRVTGKREGGILGLSIPQEEAVRRAREELASADPAGLRNYLTRPRRNRQFDRSVTKAIREGRALDPAIAANAIRGYSNKLLRYRGEVIGKHEAFSALAAGKQQAYEQAVTSGKVDAAVVVKTWKHFPNLEPRHQHIAMSGRSVGLLESFVLPDGTVMQFPHDPKAPVKHTAGCHCQADYEIDFLAGIT